MQVITEDEYERRWIESLVYEQTDFNLDGFEEIGAHKTEWDEAFYRITQLPSEIDLELWDEQIYLTYNSLVKHQECNFLTAKFYLQGQHSVICPGIDNIPPEYIEREGESYFFYLPDIEEIEQYLAKDRLKKLKITIDLASIKKFISQLDPLPKKLQLLVERENPPRCYFSAGKLTPQMHAVIQQIWQHPYQNGIARMYLEGKVWELLAMQLNQLTELLSDRTTLRRLKSQDIDRIHHARDILLSNLDDPPSIKALSQTVGIGDRKLKQGFKEIYGTTVFNYFHSYRLDRAELMLREGNTSVATVGNNIGYSHLGHFAAAFKRKFGITPRECLQGKTIVAH